MSESMLHLILFFVTSFCLAATTVGIWNYMPAKWLCDYGEAVSNLHVNRKISFFPQTFVFYFLFLMTGYRAVYRVCSNLKDWNCMFDDSYTSEQIFINFQDLSRMFNDSKAYTQIHVMLLLVWLMVQMLILICMSDRKYFIIPDQFVLVLAILGLCEIGVQEVGLWNEEKMALMRIPAVLWQ